MKYSVGDEFQKSYLIEGMRILVQKQGLLSF